MGIRKLLNMDFTEKLKDHEERIRQLEVKLASLLEKPSPVATGPFVFVDKNKAHTELLEELLKSDYCHSKNGLTFDEIIQIFSVNKRPVVPKKIRDVLAIWKKRRKIEAVKNDGRLSYFWIENGN